MGTGRIGSCTPPSMPYASHTAERPTVLILGGWSPGPLSYLKRAFYSQCDFVEPKIPMPPMQSGSICLGWPLVILVSLAGIIWAFISLPKYIESRLWLAVCRFVIMVLVLLLSRLCVATVVRGAINRGVEVATTCVMQHHNVAVVLGFSWGGAVLAEMVQRDLVGRPGQPAALLIAPTTAVVARFAMKKDAPLTVRVPDDCSERVQVFHGTHDEFWCPDRDRWELTGATLHLIRDNHVFCRQESVEELSTVLSYLLRLHTHAAPGVSLIYS